MDKRSKKDIYMENIKKTVAENMPGIVKQFPFGEISSLVIDTYKKVTEESKKEIAQQEKLKYISCMGLHCRKGFVFSKKEQNKVTAILEQSFESDDEEALKIIALFLDEYMGGSVDVRSDDCYMSEDCLSFNFSEYDDHPYVEEDIILTMNAINRLLGEELFNSFDYGEADPCYGADFGEDEEE